MDVGTYHIFHGLSLFFRTDPPLRGIYTYICMYHSYQEADLSRCFIKISRVWNSYCPRVFSIAVKNPPSMSPDVLLVGQSHPSWGVSC